MTEMNNESTFFEIVLLTFNSLIPMSFSFVEVFLKLLIWCETAAIMYSNFILEINFQFKKWGQLYGTKFGEYGECYTCIIWYFAKNFCSYNIDTADQVLRITTVSSWLSIDNSQDWKSSLYIWVTQLCTLALIIIL